MKQLLGNDIVKKCKYSKEQIYYFTYVNVYIETTCEFLGSLIWQNIYIINFYGQIDT